jgi:hypothetical protein
MIKEFTILKTNLLSGQIKQGTSEKRCFFYLGDIVKGDDRPSLEVLDLPNFIGVIDSFGGRNVDDAVGSKEDEFVREG